MNEDSVHQKLTKVSPCVGAFYDAGLRGEMTNSAGLKKCKNSTSLAYRLDLLLNYP